MAIAIDVADIGGYISDTATFAFTTSSAVASGGFIVLGTAFYSNSATLSSVSGGSLTWTIDKQVNQMGDGSQNLAIISAQAPSGLASGTTITLNHSASPATATAKGTSFTGVATSTPVDGTPTGDTSGTASWSTASYTIAAGSVIVALCQLQDTSTSTPTSPSVEAWDAAMGSYSAVVEYRIESSAGAYTVAGTYGLAGTTDNIAVAYKAAAAGTVTIPTLVMPPYRPA